MSRKTQTPSKYNNCLTGDEIDTLMNEEHEPESRVSPVVTKIMDLEVPQPHPQVDGKINNVTFKTNRPEKWKQTIMSYFGESRTCLLKEGSVIKVNFDIKGRSYSIKINFYDSGSVVIQGVKCTIFADMHFEMLKHKVEYGGEPHEEIPAQSPEKTPVSTAYISEIGSGTNATPYTPRGSTCEDSV